MGEEWATLATTIQYGRRRPGWPLDHHLLHRPGKILEGQWCAFASHRTLHMARARAHSPLESCARRPWNGLSSPPPLDIFDCSSRGSSRCVGVRAVVTRFATRRADKARERIVPRRCVV